MKTSLGYEQAYQEIEQLVRRRGAGAAQAVVEFLHDRIPGTGVCGAAVASGTTEIVSDVSKDTRYLACFPSTKSEIVVPIFRDGVVIGEIDIDSSDLNAFGDADQRFLERVAELLAPLRS